MLLHKSTRVTRTRMAVTSLGINCGLCILCYISGEQQRTIEVTYDSKDDGLSRCDRIDLRGLCQPGSTTH